MDEKPKAVQSVLRRLMRLAQTSDDSFRLILSCLTGEDVIRLMATGSKRLIAPIAQNPTLIWNLSRPALFPSCSFDFRNLRSLIVNSISLGGYVSLNGRSLLPQEPMVSLETLELSFSTSHLIFEPHPSHQGMKLCSAFPRLTSLTLQSDTYTVIAKDWAETLPKTLVSLSLGLFTS